MKATVMEDANDSTFFQFFFSSLTAHAGTRHASFFRGEGGVWNRQMGNRLLHTLLRKPSHELPTPQMHTRGSSSGTR